MEDSDLALIFGIGILGLATGGVGFALAAPAAATAATTAATIGAAETGTALAAAPAITSPIAAVAAAPIAAAPIAAAPIAAEVAAPIAAEVAAPIAAAPIAEVAAAAPITAAAPVATAPITSALPVATVPEVAAAPATSVLPVAEVPTVAPVVAQAPATPTSISIFGQNVPAASNAATVVNPEGLTVAEKIKAAQAAQAKTTSSVGKVGNTISNFGSNLVKSEEEEKKKNISMPSVPKYEANNNLIAANFATPIQTTPVSDIKRNDFSLIFDKPVANTYGSVYGSTDFSVKPMQPLLSAQPPIVSDKNLKKNIKSADRSIENFLSQIYKGTLNGS